MLRGGSWAEPDQLLRTTQEFLEARGKKAAQMSKIPKGHPLGHALAEFWRADKALREMLRISVGSFSEYEAAWRDFLGRIERVWTKIEAAMSQVEGWQSVQSRVVAERRNDPLLSYVVQARNVDEHTIQDVTADWRASLNATQIGPGQVRLEWKPWDRPLLPVRNRGVIYAPPRSHLGTDFTERLGKGQAEAVIVASMAMRYYCNLINEVGERFFRKNVREEPCSRDS